MKRIPIYRYLNRAALVIKARGITIAIDEIEFSLYLEKFFCASSDLSNVKEKIEREISMLINSYESLYFTEYSFDSSSLSSFDSYSIQKEEEQFSIKASWERIIEFYIRFSYFLGLAENENCPAKYILLSA